MKIRPVGAELFHADRQTWRIYVAFCNFAFARKMEATPNKPSENSKSVKWLWK